MLHSTTALIISFNDRLVLLAALVACIFAAIALYWLGKYTQKKKGVWVVLAFITGFAFSLWLFWQVMYIKPIDIEMVHLN